MRARQLPSSDLGVYLFVVGLGLGPLVAGPMSEIYGRNAIYRVGIEYCGRVISRRAGRLISCGVCGHQSGQLEKTGRALRDFVGLAI